MECRSKPTSVYLSQYQLIPYNRVQEYFADQLQIPIGERVDFQFQQRGLPVVDGL